MPLGRPLLGMAVATLISFTLSHGTSFSVSPQSLREMLPSLTTTSARPATRNHPTNVKRAHAVAPTHTPVAPPNLANAMTM